MADDAATDPIHLFTTLRYDQLCLQHPDQQPFYHAERHRERLIASSKQFNWPTVACLRSSKAWIALLRRAVEGATDPLRLRVELRRVPKLHDVNWLHRDDATGPPAIEDIDDKIQMMTAVRVFKTPPVDVDTLFPPTLTPDGAYEGELCSVVLDWVPTAASVWNSVKTGHRAAYSRARRRMAKVLSPTGPPGESESHPGGGMVDEVVLVGDDGQVREGSVTNVYIRRGAGWVTPPVGGESEWGLPGTVRAWALECGLCVEAPVARAEVVVGEDVWVSNAVRGFVRGRIVWIGDAQRVWPGVDYD